MICRAERAKHFKNRKCTILLQRSLLYALEHKIWNITILFIKCCKSSLHTSCFLPPLSPTLTHTPATRADRLQSMRTRGLTRAWGEERLQGGGWLAHQNRENQGKTMFIWGGGGGGGVVLLCVCPRMNFDLPSLPSLGSGWDFWQLSCSPAGQELRCLTTCAPFRWLVEPWWFRRPAGATRQPLQRPEVWVTASEVRGTPSSWLVRWVSPGPNRYTRYTAIVLFQWLKGQLSELWWFVRKFIN